MSKAATYDVAIIGGGLAGLSCSILLARQGFRVALFEKELYPFHKVCGEYISLESFDFLGSLGAHLSDKDIPMISKLLVSSPSGNTLSHELPLGGFGISRYKIDHELAIIAKTSGVKIFEETKVNDVQFTGDQFTVLPDGEPCSARIVFGAYGKRSNLDVKWKRRFTLRKAGVLNNLIAVKYHAVVDRARDLIELHNFDHGYCGISPVEENKSCICYLTTAHNLRKSDNNIRKMEEGILFRNQFIKEAFDKTTVLYEKPLAISQISFDHKSQVQNHMLMLGDAAGMIAPLCGNGMSMALHSSRFAAPLAAKFLTGHLNRDAMEQEYCNRWNDAFKRRLRAGRMIQSLFGRAWITNGTVAVLRHFPGLLTRIIRQTHG